jgi:hypothetical protein
MRSARIDRLAGRRHAARLLVGAGFNVATGRAGVSLCSTPADNFKPVLLLDTPRGSAAAA